MAKDKKVIEELVEIEELAVEVEAEPETIGTVTFTDAAGITHYSVREA